jgi:NADPH:quinone reductase-like Zn-dependent oxidoreductase
MKAIVRDEYGSPDVLRCEEIPKPIPGDDEVLIRVRTASVNPLDWHTLRAVPFFLRFMGDGILKPKNRQLGVDVAGEVEAVGRNVQSFRPGDAVFGACDFRGFAEYACVPEGRLAPKPTGATFEQAAAVPVAAMSALQALRDKGRIRRGQRVLIHGASGGVGTFAVQIAKAFEAEVTAVCRTRGLETVRSLRPDHVIDSTREDCTRSGKRYDLIVDTAAYRPVGDYRRALSSEGIYVMVGGDFRRIFQVLLLGLAGKRMSFMIAKMNQKDLLFLKELLETGKVVPVLDRDYPLSETAEALRYLGEIHPRGKVVITV